MVDERRPKAESERLVTPELAATEVAESGGDRTRTGPRVIDRHAEPRAHARVVGRFRIDAQLGSGGMGDVFRAYDTVLDRAVALKILRADHTADDAQRMRRVVREARAAAALVHPNAVTVFDVGEADDEVFIAMEFLEGEDLRSVLERGDATTSDKLRWLLEAARALAAAHERGLVHRDVKPENMFVCKGGTLKLLDFGIAKRDEEEAPQVDAAALSMGPSSLRTTEGRRVGTPRYMAPEQHAGESTDARTDEYAWGLVAFELLAGTHAVADLATMTRDGTSTSPDALQSTERLHVLRRGAPDVPEAVAQAIARALEPRKELRFDSMAPIIAALEDKDALVSSPQRIVPVEVPPPVGPRGFFIGVALVAVAVAVGIVMGLAERAKHGAAAVAPACHLESTETVALTGDDRLAVLPDGSVVIARDVTRGIVLERARPDAGTEPMLRQSMFSNLGKYYATLDLAGVMVDGQPTLVVEAMQAEGGGSLTLASEQGAFSSRRIMGTVAGMALAPLGDGIAAVVAVNEHGTPTVRPFLGIQVYAVGKIGRAPAVLDEGLASHPAVASNGTRLAVAYMLGSDIRFAFVDATLERVGDTRKVPGADAAPAVALVGESAAVFWTSDQGGKTRLTSSSFTPGAAAFSAPKVAIDEPLSPRPPVTARLPNGTFAVAWIASTGGRSTLRVSPVGSEAALTGPSTITTSATIDSLQAMATNRGIAYWWHEDEHTVRIARVACAP